MCGGKSVTLPDDLGAAERKIAVSAEPLKKLDVSRSGIRAGGHDDRNTTAEYWFDGRRMLAVPIARHGGKAMPSNLGWGVSS
jgi:hypothetical protein